MKLSRWVKALPFTIFLLLLFICVPLISFDQYILNGSATQDNCNCYTLTPQQFTQNGSVWNSNKINLNNPFDFNFNIFLGCQDANGADGMVFILQPISTSLGSSGEGMGFQGITPSIGVTLDTWQNANNNDPVFDHISIQTNGNPTHGADLAGPVQIINGNDNAEDCAWHNLRISWDPVTKWFRSYVDGLLRVEAQVDIITTIFNNDPNVYWGFTAATGGASNLQQFCTALNPSFTTNASNDAVCFGTPVSFNESSVSFAPIQQWYWDFGDGTTSTSRNPAPHLYSSPGVYEIKLAIKGLDGCISDTLRKTVAVGTKPIANFQVFDTCASEPVRVTDLSTNLVGNINSWTWILDGAPIGNSQQPLINLNSAGVHTLKLIVKSVYGCESDTMSKTFSIKPLPVIDISAPDGCFNEAIIFNGIQTDALTNITQWAWQFGDGSTSNLQNPSHTYLQSGNINITLNAMAANGCHAETKLKTINVAKVFAKASPDTTILSNIPFQIGVEFGGDYNGSPSILWSPSFGLNNDAIANPKASLTDDQTYIVTVTSPQGCSAKDTVNLKVFKGSAVYVPSGFTPNGDGRNDYLRGLYIGIKKVDYFRVYNRWGQLIFNTNNLIDGWDGTINGVKQQTGTFVWMLRAEDFAGKIYEMKGVSVLIR